MLQVCLQFHFFPEFSTWLTKIGVGTCLHQGIKLFRVSSCRVFLGVLRQPHAATPEKEKWISVIIWRVEIILMRCFTRLQYIFTVLNIHKTFLVLTVSHLLYNIKHITSWHCLFPFVKIFIQFISQGQYILICCSVNMLDLANRLFVFLSVVPGQV